MRTAKLFILSMLLVLIVSPKLVHAESKPYAHVAKGFTLSTSRGIALQNDELEAAQTREFTLGFELKPNILQLRVPFGSYEMDTRGNILPQGRVRAKSIGTSFWIGFGGERWTPFIGAGGSFYSFQEQFMTPGNLESAFGAELYGGFRIRLIDNLWDYARLRGSLHYQATLLKPGVKIPEQPDTDSISMHRHSIVFSLEIAGI